MLLDSTESLTGKAHVVGDVGNRDNQRGFHLKKSEYGVSEGIANAYLELFC